MWLPILATTHYFFGATAAIFWRRELEVGELKHHHGSNWPAKLSSLVHLSYSSLKASSCITFTVSPAFKRAVPAGTTISASAVPNPANG